MEAETQQPITKSIFIDEQPAIATNFIFDDTYRNATDKKKFQKNRQYAYFNTLVKMKKEMNGVNSNSEQNMNKSQIYKYVFGPEESLEKSHDNQEIQNHMIYESPHFAFPLYGQNRKKVLHVEKLNKNVYKIHKNNFLNKMLATNGRAEDLSMTNISFHLHFKPNSNKINDGGKSSSRSLIKTADALQRNTRNAPSRQNKVTKNNRSFSVGGQQSFSMVSRNNSLAHPHKKKLKRLEIDSDEISYVMKDYNSGGKSPTSKSPSSPSKFVPYNKQQLIGYNQFFPSKDITTSQGGQSASKILLFSKKEAINRNTTLNKKNHQESKKKIVERKESLRKPKSKLLKYLDQLEKDQVGYQLKLGPGVFEKVSQKI